MRDSSSERWRRRSRRLYSVARTRTTTPNRDRQGRPCHGQSPGAESRRQAYVFPDDCPVNEAEEEYGHGEAGECALAERHGGEPSFVIRPEIDDHAARARNAGSGRETSAARGTCCAATGVMYPKAVSGQCDMGTFRQSESTHADLSCDRSGPVVRRNTFVAEQNQYEFDAGRKVPVECSHALSSA